MAVGIPYHLLTAVESVLTGETAGNTSEFSAVDEALQTTEKITRHVAHILVKGASFDRLPFER